MDDKKRYRSEARIVFSLNERSQSIWKVAIHRQHKRTNATVVDDAIRFVSSQKSKDEEILKSSS